MWHQREKGSSASGYSRRASTRMAIGRPVWRSRALRHQTAGRDRAGCRAWNRSAGAAGRRPAGRVPWRRMTLATRLIPLLCCLALVACGERAPEEESAAAQEPAAETEPAGGAAAVGEI